MNDGGRLYAREFLVQTLEGEHQSLVVDSELVQDRGVKIPYMDGVRDDVVAEVVRLSVADTSLDAPACKPSREATWMVISTVVVTLESALTVDRPSELTCEYDYCVLQESTLSKVTEECGTRLIHVIALARELLGKDRVMVPAAVE